MNRLTQPFLGRASVLLLLGAAFVFLPFCRADDNDVPGYDVKEIPNIVYKSVDGQDICLNLFLPTKNGEPVEKCPTLLYIDSGCWYSGAPGNGGVWTLVDPVPQGYAVASISHRSLETVRFPSQIEDVRAAVRFLRAHADEYGLDKDRFATSGASSGGHLSLCLGIPDSICPFDVGENLDQSGQVQVVIDFFGPTDFVAGHWLKSVPECIYHAIQIDPEGIPTYPQKLSEEEWNRAVKFSPAFYVCPEFSPTLIFHGTDDSVVPLSQSASLYDELRNAGVPSRFCVTNNGVHDIKSLGNPKELMEKAMEFLKECGF